MSINIFVIVVCVLSLIVGAFFGIAIFKVYNNRINKKLLENAQEVLDGKRKNTIMIDGEEFDATKFRLRDNENEEIIIDLKGGGIVKDGRQKQTQTRDEEIQKQDDEVDGEASSILGEKKRTTRTRLAGVRKFG